MKQLELFLGEYGENKAHIEKLEREPKTVRAEMRTAQTVKRLTVELVPWPAHLRFD